MHTILILYRRYTCVAVYEWTRSRRVIIIATYVYYTYIVIYDLQADRPRNRVGFDRKTMKYIIIIVYMPYYDGRTTVSTDHCSLSLLPVVVVVIVDSFSLKTSKPPIDTTLAFSDITLRRSDDGFFSVTTVHANANNNTLLISNQVIILYTLSIIYLLFV